MSQSNQLVSKAIELQQNTLENSQRALEQAFEIPVQQTVELQKNAAKLFLNGLEMGSWAQNQGVDLTRDAFTAYIDTVENAADDTTRMAEQGLQTASEAGQRSLQTGANRFDTAATGNGNPPAATTLQGSNVPTQAEQPQTNQPQQTATDGATSHQPAQQAPLTGQVPPQSRQPSRQNAQLSQPTQQAAKPESTARQQQSPQQPQRPLQQSQPPRRQSQQSTDQVRQSPQQVPQSPQQVPQSPQQIQPAPTPSQTTIDLSQTGRSVPPSPPGQPTEAPPGQPAEAPPQPTPRQSQPKQQASTPTQSSPSDRSVEDRQATETKADNA